MMQPAARTSSTISTVILAGGQGSRMGGNKALQNLRGRPLIDWVFAVVRPQSAEVLISANENQTAYAHLGCPVIADHLPGYAGPLAGLQAAMQQANCAWVASVPCDTPYLPQDLIARLCTAMGDAEAAVAVVAGRRQPAIALYRKNVLPKLDAYLQRGERKVGGWLDTLHVNEAVFDDADAFTNFNSLAELEAANDK
jgi:molybdenum cofactor guanylyltransferase